MIRSLLYYLFRLRGYGFRDELRLRVALINYLLHFLTGRLSGGSLGFYIPGQDLLRIKTWDGYIFYVRPKTPDPVYAILSLEQYELRKWFLPYAKGIVVDVGANIGGYAVRVCRRADLVVAIEPERETFNILQKNVEINCTGRHVILVEKAIGETEGKAVLKVPKKGKHIDTSVASLVKPSIDWKDYAYEEVNVSTLDNIMASLGIENVNFLKVDIEGAEALAFRGMRRTLENTKYLMIEIRDENRWIIEELLRIGFKLIERRGMNYFFVKSWDRTR